MSVETVERGQWIFLERSLPGYFIYRLLEGKVSIYHSSSKINEIEVKRGDKPVLIGMISALRPDGLHIASVRSETQLKVERIYSDQVRGILHNEAPESAKKELKTIIDTIIVRNEIEALKNRLKTLSAADVKIPDNLSAELKEVLDNINDLYKHPEQQ
jgi:CRP-like cAMP-binding protein